MKNNFVTPVEFGKEEEEIFLYVKGNCLSMVSDERLFATILTCSYVAKNNIDGDFVECGVFRGGNAILAAAVFKIYGSLRRVWLFDTFAGMTMPSYHDTEASTGRPALDEYMKNKKETHCDWAYSSMQEVVENFSKAKLLSDDIVFVKGDVLKTLDNQSNLPRSISVLRLDTDWYESTKKELDVLYPRVSQGGFLMIDDYGHFEGAKKAVDEYFAYSSVKRPFFHYIDYTGRVGVKWD